MKRKNIIYVIVVFLLSISVIITTLVVKNKDNNKMTILLGNQIETNIEVNDTFTSSFMDSLFLLNLIKNDASKQVDNKIVKLSVLIKNSNKIIINIGKIDIDNNIDVKEDRLYYDYDILNACKEKLINNVIQIKNYIYLINKKASIEILPLTYQFEINDKKIIDLYNEINKNFIQ